MFLEEWVIVFAVLAFVLVLILRKRLLKPTAIATGLVTALFVAWRGGLGAFFAIILFFLIGEFVTRMIRDKHASKKHGTRSTSNIVGNIGPAIIALVINPSPFNIMFFASLSAAFADTLSSEIGVLSREQPLMITTLKPVSPGTDGGVSILGFAAAALGGLIYALIAFAVSGNAFLSIMVFAAGVFGSVFDSFLGATLQSRGYLDNNLVNFVSSLSVGIIFALLF